MPLSVEIDPAKLAEIDRKVSVFTSQEKVNKAINSAAKRAAQAGMVMARRQIPKHYTLPAKIITDSKIMRSGQNDGTGVVGASFRIKDRPRPLLDYTGVTPKEPNTGKALKIRIKKSNSVRRIKSPQTWFVSTASASRSQTEAGQKGGIAVFRRVPGEYMKNPYTRHELHGKKSVWSASRKPKWKHKRQKIEKVYTVGASSLLTKDEILPMVTKRSAEVLNTRLEAEIKRLVTGSW